MQITQPLKRALASRPEALATVCGERLRNVAQVHARVARLAGALRSLGVQGGCRVGVLATNSDRYVEAHMAVPWAGAVIHPMNTRWSAAEIAHALDDCDTRVLLIDEPFLPLLPELRQRSRALATLVHMGDGPTPQGLLPFEALISSAAPAPDANRGGSDLAGIFHTSGTTGPAKGVMLSHDALMFNALTLAAEGVVRAGERALHAVPLFHTAGVGLLNSTWAVGGTQVTLPTFEPLAALQLLEREAIQATVLLPAMMQTLADHSDTRRFDLSALRRLAYGGAPIGECLLARAAALLPHTEFSQVYGMAELAPTVTVLPPALHTEAGRARGKLRSAGQPALGVEVRVVDALGQGLPPGRRGELLVKSPGAMLGYWNRPEATRAALREGWVRTGDVAWLDDEGFVFIVGRVRDMLATGGEGGERVHAAVVLKPGAVASAEEVRAHCEALVGGCR